MKLSTTFKLAITSTLVMMSGAKTANAALLDLSHDPLFLNQSVPPALAVTFDDSGSMAWGFMGRGLSNSSSTYDRRSFADPTRNKIYYNPNINYRPPIGADGVELPNSVFTAAKVDGFDSNSATVDLSRNFLPIARYYYYGPGDYQLRFAKIPNTPNVDTVNTNNYNDYYPNRDTRNARGRSAFYYLGDTRVDVPAGQRQNFANWYTYYSTRNKLAKSAVSRSFSTFGPTFKIAWQQLNRNTNFPDLERFDEEHRKDFFRWLFRVPSNGGTPLRNAFYRAGNLFTQLDSYDSDDFNTRLSCQQNFHIAISDGEWNQSLSYTVDQDETNLGQLAGDDLNLYGGYNGGGEQHIYPLSEGGTSLSDIAFHFWQRDLVPGLNNNVKRYKGDYTDSTGADIVFAPGQDEWQNPAFIWNPKNDPAYWQHMVTYNIGMGLEASRILDYQAGNFANCPEDTSIADPKEAVLKGLRSGACDWPIASNALTKIDDVWHSSINSRGDFFGADDPEQLAASLNAVVNSILERLSRGSTSTVSSGVITAGTQAYTPGFDSSNWTGNLLARPVNADGDFGAVTWDLACKLTGGNCESTGGTEVQQTNRRIYAHDPITGNVERLLPGVGGNLDAIISLNGLGVITRLSTSVDDIIRFVNGDNSVEIQGGGVLRNRDNKLSDVVHASPIIQRGPGESYSDTRWPDSSDEFAAAQAGNGYIDYKINNANRTNVVYIGSNSGMLHAVYTEGPSRGQEIWGYMPSKALENIHRLVDPVYEHWSYVDNSPVLADAFISSQWRTVLVGGMRYGGQAYYALDVTNPTATAPDAMWEFTDRDDADMGYSYGRANIARISSTGDWVALIPNGYNNSENDGIQGDGSAVLYVVRLRDGQLLAKLDTNVGSAATPNGMGPAQAVDSIYGVGLTSGSIGIDQGADYAYAGDLYGNLWRFDFRSSNYSDWENSSNIVKVFDSGSIMHRPITEQPRVVSFDATAQGEFPVTPEKDSLVMFGTGKYLEVSDRSISLPSDQYIVGFADAVDNSNVFTYNSAELIPQELEKQILGTDANGLERAIRNFRTNSEVDYIGGDWGWTVELNEQGERMTNPMSVIGTDILLAATTVTAGIDPCEAGGKSWILAIDPLHGATPDSGNIFELDATVTDPFGNPQTQVFDGTGIQVNDLIVGRPPIIENQGGGNSNIIIEGAGTTTVIEFKKFTWRRRNWSDLLIE
ncbi:pilus assembly protein [Marinicella meishanensis]|uniref:pilus assembly protein n=1 Tax=Marinicella meishanensis TaxID=2873263 RepID=UPI001CBECC6A|nr:PilC/PilY family type IV pilus protein [Marinicella sp. NBU2979]